MKKTNEYQACEGIICHSLAQHEAAGDLDVWITPVLGGISSSGSVTVSQRRTGSVGHPTSHKLHEVTVEKQRVYFG